MLKIARLWLVTCLAAAFIAIPWSDAAANERGRLPATRQSQSLGNGSLWRSALALVPSESRVMSRSESLMMRQVVASTNESKLLIALIAGTGTVVGATMVAHGATGSCKGGFGNTDDRCDRIVMLGAAGMAAGATMLSFWAFSR